MPDPLAENHYDLNPYHYVMGNPMMYIDPLGLDTAKIKDGGKLPEVKIRKVYNPYDNPFLEYLTAEQDAKRQAGLLTGYELLTSGSKRSLTPEELLAKRKAEEDRLRRIEYDSKRHNYGKMQINPWGPSLIMLGEPIIPKDGTIVKYFYGHAFAVGKNKSTSVASIASRVTVRKIEQKVGNKVGNTIGKKAAGLIFKRLGGLLGRATPLAGWAITTSDLWEFRNEIAGGAKAFSMGAGDYYKLQADPKNGWMYIK